MKKQPRPYMQLLAPALIPLILAGDANALTEATHRTNPKVARAVASLKAPKSTSEPKPERKTGAGSRGGSPTKFARTIYAEAMSGAHAPEPEFWASYKSDACKEFAQGITSHTEAQEQLALLMAGE